jgi:hypothetical protein
MVQKLVEDKSIEYLCNRIISLCNTPHIMQSSSYVCHTPPPNIFGRWAHHMMDSLVLLSYCTVVSFSGQNSLSFHQHQQLPYSSHNTFYNKMILPSVSTTLCFVRVLSCCIKVVTILRFDLCVIPFVRPFKQKKHAPQSHGTQSCECTHSGGGWLKSFHSAPSA